jgi:hypothetical protein
MIKFNLEFTEPEVGLIVTALDQKKTEYIRMIERIVSDCRAQIPAEQNQQPENSPEAPVAAMQTQEESADKESVVASDKAKKAGRPKGVKNKQK